MNSNSTSRMPMLAGVGLALAALLLLLPAPMHADTLNATDDTYTNKGSPATIFGSKQKIKVKKKGNGNDLVGFAKFDLSVLGTDPDDIDKATLRLWIRKVKSAGKIEICRVLGAWAESSLTSNGALALTFPDCFEVEIFDGDEGSWKLVDVKITTWVKLWLDVTPNDGIAIFPLGTNIQLDSKESKGHSHPMEIEATHDAPGNAEGDLPGPNHPHAAIFENYQRVSSVFPLDLQTTKNIVVICPSAKKVLGGGGVTFGGNNVVITASFPGNDTTWTFTATERGTADAAWSAEGFAICATVP